MTIARDLARVAVAQAAAEEGAGRYLSGIEWMDKVDPKGRPADLERRLLEGAVLEATANGRWPYAISLLERRLRLGDDRLLRLRLQALRGRRQMMADDAWTAVGAKVPAAQRLASDSIYGITGVWAAGAYHSRGRDRGAPWSKLLRAAKDPSEVEDGWAMLRLACDYSARFVFARTPLLRSIHAVVAVPARPAKYVERMMGLPDELANALRSQLGLPYLSDALVSTVDELEIKRYSHAERRKLIRESMAPGRAELVTGRVILIVDDITTSGATLGEAARQMAQVGAKDVFAFALAHTEG